MSQEEALIAKKVAEEEAAKYKNELHRVSDARMCPTFVHASVSICV